MKLKRLKIDFRTVILMLSLVFFFLFESTSQVSGNLLSANYITAQNNSANFILSESGLSAPLVLDANDFPGVIKIAGYLQEDIFKVTQSKPNVIMGEMPQGKDLVIIGTIGKSSLIDTLIKRSKINIDDVAGKWETSLIAV